MKGIKFFGFSSLAIGLQSVVLTVEPAQAASLEIIPAAQSVEQGDLVEIKVAISELGDFTPPSLGAFDVDVSFDPNLLAFGSVTFGDPILGDQLDLFGLGSLTGVIPGVGTVNLAELSFDLPADLDSLQAGSFTLATLSFNTLATGTTSLGISVNDLADSLGSALPIDSVSGGAVTVTPSSMPIPEPSFGLVSLLFALGLGRSLMRKQTS